MSVDGHLLERIREVCDRLPQLELAVLIGSRATGTDRPDSDWDIAIQWSREIDYFQQLAAVEQLRRTVAKSLDLPEGGIDLINLPSAQLAMRAVVAEEGIPLKGGDSLIWQRFLQRTWRELEEQYWEDIYAV